MNKHIIGLIIFSFIVGMSAFIASFFVKMPQMPSIDPVNVSESRDYIYNGTTSCRKKKRKPRPKAENEMVFAKVSQAVFNLNKKQLDTQFMLERNDESVETVKVALHFFVNDKYGVQHISTEYVTLNPNFDLGDKAITTNASSFKWLNKLESRENLYVISEVVNSSTGNYNNPPAFDSYEATAVLVSPQSTVKSGGILQ